MIATVPRGKKVVGWIELNFEHRLEDGLLLKVYPKSVKVGKLCKM